MKDYVIMRKYKLNTYCYDSVRVDTHTHTHTHTFLRGYPRMLSVVISVTTRYSFYFLPYNYLSFPN